MRKKDLIKEIADELEVARPRAEEIYSTIVKEMMGELGRGRRMTLSGFGTFHVVNRRSKLGRNPRTGEILQVPEHRSVKFNAGRNLVESLRNGH